MIGGNGNIADGNYALIYGNTGDANGNTNVIIFTDEALSVGTSNRAYFHYINGYRLYTATGDTVGVKLDNADTSWSSVCDRFQKEDFEDLDYDNILTIVINDVPVQAWRMKARNPSNMTRSLGCMAQDFAKIFPTGKPDTQISNGDAIAVNLACIHALAARNTKLETRVLALETENIELKSRLASIETTLTSWSSSMAMTTSTSESLDSSAVSTTSTTRSISTRSCQVCSSKQAAAQVQIEPPKTKTTRGRGRGRSSSSTKSTKKN